MGKKVKPGGDEAAGGGSGGDVSPENAPANLRKRSCTDCCCVLFFIAFMCGMLYLTFLAWTYGEPAAILYGKDYLGNRCGVGTFSNKSKVIYPRIDQDLLEQAAIASSMPWRVVFYGVCVEACPSVPDPTVCFTDPSSCMVYDYGTPAQWGSAGGAAYYFAVLPTLDVLNRCVPTKHVSASSVPDRCAYPSCDNVTNPWMVCDTEHPSLWIIQSLSDQLACEVKFQHVEVDQLATMTPSPLVERIATSMAFVQRVTGALVASWSEIIGFGFGLSIGLGIAWLVLLRLFAKTVVWLAVLAIGLALGAASLYLFATSGALDALLEELAGNSTGIYGGLLGNLSAALSSANEAIVSVAPDELTEASNAAGTANPFLYQVAAWVCLVLTVCYLLFLCLARKKVRICAALIKESTVVLKDRPVSFLVPFATLALQAPIMLYFVLGLVLLGTANLELAHFVGGAEAFLNQGAAYADVLQALGQSIVAGDGSNATAAAANGTIDDGGNSSSPIELQIPAESPWWVQPAVYIFFLFGVLWVIATVKNTAWTALSGSFVDWYFFRRDPKLASRLPLLDSLRRVLRYHLGSILFGSFVIAVIQLLRILLAILDRATKGKQDKKLFLKLVMKGAQLCMWCLEKTVKFITDYCYIYVAMQGTGFCRSCFAVFSLILGQPAQLALNTIVRLVLALIQMVAIPCACAWLCLVLLQSQGKPEPIYPAGAVAIIAFVIAQSFAVVMSCALDTLFVCCVRDKKEYKSAFMSDRLHYAFGFDKSDRKEKRAAKKAAKAAGTAEGGN
jgi:choline transporter-like protein 2/4/5